MGTMVFNTLEHMAGSGEKPTYEQLELLYTTCFKSLEEMAKERDALQAVVGGQVRANNSLGVKDQQREALLADQIAAHNATVQGMGAEIDRLRALVVVHGGNPDEE